jgi:hypothetical protein
VRFARAAAALALAAAPLVAVPSASGQPEPPALVRVDVRGLSRALVPGEDESLTVRARVLNTSAEPVRRLRVWLRAGQQVRGRSSIAVGGALARFGQRIGDVQAGTGELAPSATADADFDVPVAQLPFRNSTVAGVYPLRIEVRSGFQVVGAADTYVVWWPPHSPTLRMAWVWPLVEPSHRALGNDFYDDDLAASVAGGRLDNLLRIGAAQHMPLTWAVDPELLDSLRRMSGPYSVRGKEGTRNAAAKAWLDRARSDLADATVLPLPYADPDLAATATGPLAPDAGRAFQLGREILRRDIGNEGSARFAWPAGDTLPPDVESLLSGQGVKGVVVPDSALPLAEQLYYTPTAAAPLGAGALGTMSALVTDPQLAGHVAAGTTQDGPRLAVQRFLADAALIALERPNDARDVVVAPPRTWEPLNDYAQLLLQLTVAVPWVRPITLDAVLADEPSAAPRTRAPVGPGVLPPDQLRRVLAQRTDLERLRSILTDPKRAPEEVTALDDALLRAVSSSWGADGGAGARLTTSVGAELTRQVGRLRFVAGGLVTMTGRSGGIPLTIQNDLGQPVRIRVRLDSKQRLQLERKAYERGEEVVIPPGVYPLVVKGKATTGGLFPINVELLAPDGSSLGIRRTLRVRSTAYGAVALTVTGVAFGLLLVASATRLVQRRRKARGGTPTAPEPVAA